MGGLLDILPLWTKNKIIVYFEEILKDHCDEWAADMANLALQITPPPYQVQTQCSWAGPRREGRAHPGAPGSPASCTLKPWQIHLPPALQRAGRVNHTLKIRILMSSKRYFGNMIEVTCTRQEHDDALMFEKFNYCDTLA
jgi:hypothetical protein